MGFEGTIDVKRKPSAKAIKAAWEWESQTWGSETMREEWKEGVADISWLQTQEGKLYGHHSGRLPSKVQQYPAKGKSDAKDEKAQTECRLGARRSERAEEHLKGSSTLKSEWYSQVHTSGLGV
jgi:hypothetical protein